MVIYAREALQVDEPLRSVSSIDCRYLGHQLSHSQQLAGLQSALLSFQGPKSNTWHRAAGEVVENVFDVNEHAACASKA